MGQGADPRADGRAPELLRRRVSVLVSLCVLIASAVGAEPVLSESEPLLYLMTLRVGDRVLAEDVVVQELNGTAFVGFAAFVDALEFPIHRAGDTWTGWARSPRNEFRWSMDATTDSAISSGAASGPVDWLATAEGVAVSQGTLESWFAVELTIDTRRQLLTVRSAEALPIQQREARRARRTRGVAAGPQGEPVEIPDEYRLLTSPMIDVSVDATWKSRGGRSSDAQSLGIDVGLDVLKHSVIYDAQANRSDRQPSELRQRLTVSRAAATADGSLGVGLTRYELGDVFTASSNLIDGGGNGAGLIVERRKGGRRGTLGEITISGDATPGWDIELYRNGQLVALGVVDFDGRYVFEDQELTPGENLFLARLFGPQGQVREARQVAWGGGVDLEPGEVEFRVAHVDFSERLLDGGRDDDEFLAAERLTDVRSALGLTKNLQAGAAFSWADVNSRKEPERIDGSEYVSLFWRASLPRGLLLGEVVKQLDGGSAWSLQYLASFRGHDLSFSHESFDEFESPRTRRRAESRSRSQVTLAGPLQGAGLEHYLVRVTHEDRVDGPTDLRVFSRIGAAWGPLTLTNDLEAAGLADGGTTLRGRVRAAARWQAVNVSGSAEYELTADDPLKQLSATVRWNARSNLFASWTVRHQMSGDGATYLEGLISARVKGIDWSFRASTSTEDSWSVGVGVLLHLAREGPGRGYLSESRGLSRSGRASLSLFIDRNNNGLRESDEVPVSWVSYKGRESSETVPGLVTLAAVPAGVPVIVETRHLVFDDPFLTPRDARYQLFTHPGAHVRVDIPVVVLGDVAGYLRDGEGRGLAGVEVRLLDSTGRQIATRQSEYDGYYSFDGMAAGEYRVVVRHLSSPMRTASRAFVLDPDQGLTMLEVLELEAAAAQEPLPLIAGMQAIEWVGPREGPDGPP